MRASSAPKHQRVFATLNREIRTGRWNPGDRLPSEAQLVERFGVSRITVSRAMRDLQSAGFVDRRAGSGSYVTEWRDDDAYSFGLLIPDLGETEIFEPLCQGMMASPLAGRHALLWGNSAGSGKGEAVEDSKAEHAWRLCRQYIDRRVSGVFFAPLEHAPDKDEYNRRIVEALARAHIPVVLLDRPVRPFPHPPSHDLIGIDNRAAGYVLTDHLLQLGCRRLCFVGMAGAASTVDDRASGFREALHAHDVPFDRSRVHRIKTLSDDAVQAIMVAQQPDGIFCANDSTAGHWMHALRRIGHTIPDEVRIVGIDDAGHASLLPVPLTTMRQPARRIGDVALGVMLERLARPDLPTRDVRLHGELIVRESCGAPAESWTGTRPVDI